MPWSYDPATDAGKVRLLIPDIDGDVQLFQDDEIAAFLSLEGDDIRLAAAQALDTLASHEAYVQKVISLLDFSTNGPSVARELRERAKALREQAAAGMGADVAASFDIAEMVTTPFGARERWANQVLRGVY